MKRIKSVLARVLVTSMVLGLLPIGQASGSDAAAKIKLSGKKLTVTKGKTKKLSVKNAKKYSCFENEIKMWVYEELIEGKKLSEIINEKHENVKYPFCCNDSTFPSLHVSSWIQAS